MQLNDMSVDNIIKEYKLIDFSDGAIDTIVDCAVLYSKSVNITLLSAFLIQRNFLMRQLNNGIPKNDAVSALIEEYPICYPR